jgi:peptidoglycan hydrolase-like protein with peptidoglycan-binding domain
VEQFQRQEGLEPGGIVDTVTWNRLYNTYRSQYESLPENYFSGATAPYPGTPLSRGSRGMEVMRIQEYLNYISNTYTAIPKIDVDGVFGPGTANAVRAYQTLFGIEPSGIVGAATWESITETYRELVQGNQASGTQFGGDMA